jgi:hypothetical protein
MKTIAEQRVLTERHRRVRSLFSTPEEYYSRPSRAQSVDAAALCFAGAVVCILVALIASLLP